MPAFPSLLRSLAILLCLVSSFSARVAAAPVVGTVSKVENQAKVGTTPAVVGTPVHMNDELRTGPNARLEVTFRDDSVLTLGEMAKVVIDRYVFNPQQGTGELALTTTRAAFRFTTGRLNQLPDHSIIVNTPVAALAVRGTDFWGGIVDYQYGVLLLKGKLNVSNSGGEAEITTPNQGIDFAPTLKKGPQGPGKPYQWPKEKIERALAQTNPVSPPPPPPPPPPSCPTPPCG
jgi:hypothetical protein